MNVRVEYLYRDAGNYKSWNEVVFRNGRNLDPSVIESDIRAALIDGEFFVAEDVGMPPLYFETYDKELDHLWHEFAAAVLTDCSETDDANRDVTDFIASLKSAIQRLSFLV